MRRTVFLLLMFRGIAAVVAVNMVIAAYVIGAFRENLDVDEDLKEKKD